jgi:hypothetical protein
MYRIPIRSTMLLVALLASAAPRSAGARDFCINQPPYTPTGDAFVLKGFKVPHRSDCHPVAGYAWRISPVDFALLSGTACTSTDGTLLNVAFQLHIYQPTGVESTTTEEDVTSIPLPLPNSTFVVGNYARRIYNATGPGGVGSGNINAQWCDPQDAPHP